MLRNLLTGNSRPSRPTRRWRKTAGPEQSSLTAAAISSKSGAPRTSIDVATARSRPRLAAAASRDSERAASDSSPVPGPASGLPACSRSAYGCGCHVVGTSPAAQNFRCKERLGPFVTRVMDQNAKPRLLSVIGSRPEIVQAAPLSAALADRVEEILVHTGQHYDPEMSGPADRRPEAAAARVQPRRRLAARCEQGVAVARGADRRRDRAASGPTRSSSAATPTRRSPAPAPPSPPGCRCSTSRPACAATATTCPRSTTGSRPTGSPTFSSHPASTPATSARGGRSGHGARHRRRRSPTSCCSTRARLPEGGEAGRVRARHRPSQLQHRLARAPRRGARLPAARRELRVIFPLHPRTRKSLETWGLEAARQRRGARRRSPTPRC